MMDIIYWSVRLSTRRGEDGWCTLTWIKTYQPKKANNINQLVCFHRILKKILNAEFALYVFKPLVLHNCENNC